MRGFEKLLLIFYYHKKSLTPPNLCQSSEPHLIANLWCYFADFPYLHWSIDQRLLTLETCCGYEYGWVWYLL